MTLFIGTTTCVNAQKTFEIKKTLSSMSLEEKAALVIGKGMETVLTLGIDSTLVFSPGDVGYTKQIVPGAAGYGITPMVLSDGPAGLRILPKRENDNGSYYCTAFPVATVLASSWDTELVKRVGTAMGNEVHEYGADVLLAPAMNIHRNPLCGRNFEYYSEDPVVAGNIAAAMVNGVESQGVGTSVKHFAANNQETNRNSVNNLMSERALREIYLEGFRIAIQKSQPWTVMSSYNLINGTCTSESYDLLTTILRDEWGFKGFVMTDWFGGQDAVAQMKAGNDVIMPGMPFQSKDIIEAVKSGKLSMQELDRNCERLLNIMLLSPHFMRYPFSNKPDLKLHAQVTRQAATDGMVLLKNEKEALPIAKTVKKIALFGNTSYNIIKGGTGSGNVNAAYSIDLLQGLSNAGYEISPSLKDSYVQHVKSEKEKLPKQTAMEMNFGAASHINEMLVDAATAETLAAENDIALVTIGRESGEFFDRKLEGDFNLTDKEKTLLATVATAFHAKGKKMVVVLNICGVIETASWRNIPDAILLAWLPGQEAGNSIADVLSGKVNPSGKLTSTFPISYSDVPSSKSFPGIELTDAKPIKLAADFLSSKPAETVYNEGIYVGYRYYNTFKVPVAYEFGYGLSYTKFAYSNLRLSSKTFSKSITATVTVKNTGKVAGREVVELYLSAPASSLDKPTEELKSFAKTRLLKPGESQQITFTISKRNLASFNTSCSSWVADAGKYTVKIGASSRDFRQTGTFSLPSKLLVEKGHKALAPSRTFSELKPEK
ncbi:MAG: beta-glucosidase [Bacteroidetes bacterium]|nr:beta-glucosidase [Bacteroidota bacterium]